MSDQSGLPVTPPNPADEPPTKNRKPLIIGIVVVVVLALIAGLYLFQPWKLFTSKEVNEALPSVSATPTASATGSATPSPAATNLTLASGTFRSYEHETTGKASLIQLTNGTTILRLTDFKTSDGPDVKVWLSVNPASKAEGARDAKYVDLGDLKGTVGNQNYTVPASAADQTWGSVVIWCDRFSVPFGAADLKPAAPTPR